MSRYYSGPVSDHDTVENAEWAKARGDFAVYRKVIRREMLWDWWPQEVSEKLQQFYKDLKDGKRPKIAIMAPPTTSSPPFAPAV